MSILPAHIPLYTGVIGHKYPRCERSVVQAYSSWLAQKAKCNNEKHHDYKWYGAKGISVQYGSRDFISWWLYSLSSFNGNIPTCGRIDHSRGYSFNNIEMQDSAYNAHESAVRNDIGQKNQMGIRMQIRNGHKVFVKCPKTKQTIAIIPSMREAARLFDTTKKTIGLICDGKWNTGTRSKKINFILSRE